MISSGYSAAIGNDGDINTCVYTLMEPYPWWAVDLGARYVLTHVAVYTVYIVCEYTRN